MDIYVTLYTYTMLDASIILYTKNRTYLSCENILELNGPFRKK